MSSYKAGNGTCCLVLIGGRQSQMWPFDVLVYKKTIFYVVSASGLSAPPRALFYIICFREIGFAQRKQGCKKKVHSEA